MFDEYYEKAPEEIKEVVDSYETATILGDIARENNVDVNGFGNPVIGRLTGRILIGMINPKDFIPNLEKELDISNEKARIIAKEVNEKIFAPVKDFLIEIHQLGGVKKEAIKTASNKGVVLGITAVGLSEKNYRTSPELFEQKLKQSLIQKPVEKIMPAEPLKQKPRPIDPYKEDTVITIPEQIEI